MQDTSYKIGKGTHNGLLGVLTKTRLAAAVGVLENINCSWFCVLQFGLLLKLHKDRELNN